jgi:hypothetical protein
MHMDIRCLDPWALVHKLMDDILPRWVSFFSSACNAFTGVGVSFTNLEMHQWGGHLNSLNLYMALTCLGLILRLEIKSCLLFWGLRNVDVCEF